jgi:hypothetical protein
MQRPCYGLSPCRPLHLPLVPIEEEMKVQKVDFDHVATSLRRILSISTDKELKLIPNYVYKTATEQGIILEWKNIEKWQKFKSGDYEFKDDEFIRIAFSGLQPEGKIYIVTDECFEDQKAFVVEYSDLKEFIQEIYPEIYQMDFEQPFDFIFVNPEKEIFSMIHHEGLVTQYRK